MVGVCKPKNYNVSDQIKIQINVLNSYFPGEDINVKLTKRCSATISHCRNMNCVFNVTCHVPIKMTEMTLKTVHINSQ